MKRTFLSGLVVAMALISVLQIVMNIHVTLRQPTPGMVQLTRADQYKSSPLPVYWINLNESKDRRLYMEELFSNLTATLGPVIEAVRVSALNRSDVVELLSTKGYIPNGVRIVQASKERGGEWHRKKKYTHVEVACMLSHLKAILQSYNDGHKLALFTEDDAVLTSSFLTHWKAYAELAPSDWNVLQWTSSNKMFAKHASHLQHDPWVPWTPTHYGTVTYMLSRKGMERILQHSLLRGTNGSYQWYIDEPELIVADEVVYYLGKQSYTSTFPWIGTAGLSTTLADVHGSSELSARIDLPSMSFSLRAERIQVVTSLLIEDEAAISMEVERLKMDVMSLSKWHPDISWIVNAVVVNEPLKKQFLDAASALPACIDVRTHIDLQRFNKKFSFIEPISKEFSLYDYVLLKHSDMRLTGFAWNTFMERKGAAIVSGPLHESVDESLARFRPNKPTLHLHRFYEARKWRALEVSEYTTVSPIPTMFVDPDFVLMRGDFASWFFSQALTPWYVSQPMDLGLEFMWCGAAKSFAPDAPSCLTVPVIVVREDTMNTSMSEESLAQGEKVVQRLREDSVFCNWIDAAAGWWDRLNGDGAGMEDILPRCRNIVGLPAFPPVNYTSTKQQRGGMSDINSEDDILTKCSAMIIDGWVESGTTAESNATTSPSIKKSLEFVHATKTGGSAIEKAAAEHGIRWGACHFRNANFSEMKCPSPPDFEGKVKSLQYPKVRGLWHIPPQFWQPKLLKGQKTFTVVRNPYDRAVSHYYDKFVGYKGPNRHDPLIMNAWIQNMVHNPKGIIYLPHHKYVYGVRGLKEVDVVLHFENLTAEFHELMQLEDLPIRLDPIPYNERQGGELNATHFTNATIRAINQYCAKDFEYFGYSLINV